MSDTNSFSHLTRPLTTEEIALNTQQYAQKQFTTTTSDRMFLLRWGEELFALPVSYILAIESKLPIHTLPGRRSEYLLGITIIREHILPVINVAKILGITKAERKTAVLLQTQQGKIGSFVDEVLGILPCTISTQNIPSTLSSAASALLIGTSSTVYGTASCIHTQAFSERCKEALL